MNTIQPVAERSFGMKLGELVIATVLGMFIYLGFLAFLGRSFGKTELMVVLAVTAFNAIRTFAAKPVQAINQGGKSEETGMKS